MIPCLRAKETFVAETFMFLIFFFRKIFLPQQMFRRLRAEETMLTGFCGRIGFVS